MVALLRQCGAQFGHVSRQHGFAAGDHDMIGRVLTLDPVNDLLDGKLIARWLPRGERRVAEIAAQIATAGANENAFGSSQRPFPLPRLIDFGNQHVGLFGRVRWVILEGQLKRRFVAK